MASLEQELDDARWAAARERTAREAVERTAWSGDPETPPPSSEWRRPGAADPRARASADGDGGADDHGGRAQRWASGAGRPPALPGKGSGADAAARKGAGFLPRLGEAAKYVELPPTPPAEPPPARKGGKGRPGRQDPRRAKRAPTAAAGGTGAADGTREGGGDAARRAGDGPPQLSQFELETAIEGAVEEEAAAVAALLLQSKVLPALPALVASPQPHRPPGGAKQPHTAPPHATVPPHLGAVVQHVQRQSALEAALQALRACRLAREPEPPSPTHAMTHEGPIPAATINAMLLHGPMGPSTPHLHARPAPPAERAPVPYSFAAFPAARDDIGVRQRLQHMFEYDRSAALSGAW